VPDPGELSCSSSSLPNANQRAVDDIAVVAAGQADDPAVRLTLAGRRIGADGQHLPQLDTEFVDLRPADRVGLAAERPTLGVAGGAGR
jgi:hypothetical protein